jgi:hypothetical protein
MKNQILLLLKMDGYIIILLELIYCMIGQNYARVRIDGSEKTEIFDGGLGDIVVDGDWIYADASPPERVEAAIYRIKADGSSKEFIPVNY